MSDEAKRLLELALQLPAPDRAELAATLLESIEGQTEEPAAVEAAWATEIERRAHHAIANPEDGVAWEVVRAELYAEPAE
jgi:putative addiction module component (TIGR02574 family)